MAAYEYDDFWVEFSPRAGGGYSVAARAPDGATSKGSFQLPFTNEQLEAAVRTLGYTRAATTRDIGDVTNERRLTAEQLGGELAKSLLSGPTGELYGTARASAVAKGRGVRLWLSLGTAPGLLSVPWEFLYLQPTFLASQRKTPIVRFLRTQAPVAPRRIEDSVRILGVVASPDGLPKLDVAGERKRVDDALGKARRGRDVTIDWLDPATPRELRLALQKGEYHILHFVGHSGYVDDDAKNGGGGGGVIFLENEDHSRAQVSDAQLVNLIGDQDSLRLVVLNSCEGARTSVVDPFAGIATSIVALGIPAVVAMQFEISDKAAITFAEELYQSLIARQDPIDVAVAEARKAVFTEVNETEWATPVLFLRNEDGRIFDFAPAAVAGTGAAIARALSVDEDVQFTVYRPRTVRPSRWYSLLAFAHLSTRRQDAAADEPDPIEEVRRQAVGILGRDVDDYTDLTQDSSEAVPREGDITFKPFVEGIEFNPGSRTFRWSEDVHREEFRLRAAADLDGRTARGRLSVFLGTILLADVPIAIRVDGSVEARSEPDVTAEQAHPYRRIFASYSHRDVAVARQFERFAGVLGDRYVRDVIDLRTGEVWSKRIEELIREADIFQLFWSTNSMRSIPVQREWQYALALDRPNFVRPTYWEWPMPRDPVADLPPEALRQLHFERIGLESSDDGAGTTGVPGVVAGGVPDYGDATQSASARPAAPMGASRPRAAAAPRRVLPLLLVLGLLLLILLFGISGIGGVGLPRPT